ncbi:hypothetical protein D1007_39753 [Hordeum vulgare]|nr:hypothetical protein D1007_39753 [Hordeum vulgare]
MYWWLYARTFSMELECLPVARPKDITYNAWDDKSDELRLPTWAYKWDVVSKMTSDVTLTYRQYINELDTITAKQVEWEPYGATDRLGNAGDFVMNPMCLRDRHLLLMSCRLICNWAVELHMPHRVYCQIGLFQSHPLEWQDIEKALQRKKQRKIKECDKYHKKYVTMFELSVKKAQAIRNQIKKVADESVTLLHTTQVGKTMGKVRFENSLRSATPSYAPSGNGAHLENETTSTTQLEDDDVVTQEVDDDMTLQDYQVRSAYFLKPRKEFKRLSPEDYNIRGKRAVGGSSWIVSLDDDVNDDEEESELVPKSVAPSTRKKIATKRGRK